MPRNANQSKSANYSLDFDGASYKRIISSLSIDAFSSVTMSERFKPSTSQNNKN